MNVGKAQSLDMATVSGVIIITNIAAISVTLLEAIREKYLERKKYKLIRLRKYQNDLRYHVQRLWWRAMSYAMTEVYLDRKQVDSDVQPSFRVVLELARRQKATSTVPAADQDDGMPTIALDEVAVAETSEEDSTSA
ncbi:hypothetical protein DYB32_004226 [Aphanomyces invadans]|uniref:Uncharacterized protein n=1 Tax=Aphanomyces invadans TaxID=157072 RepID=A0A3R6VBZ8_9STRA|nr:hypothetical protein DYB32_004226 [Aphanomyces invadans]